MNIKIKEFIYKFLEKYIFIYKAAADGWIVKYSSRNKIEFSNNIKNIPPQLSESTNFISYYNKKIVK